VRTSGYAFFDVDGTITRKVTLFRFLDFVARSEGTQPGRSATLYRLDELRRAGASRTELNRAYYEAYTALLETEVRALGKAWFAVEAEDGEFLNAAVVGRLITHRRAGDVCVLVSGSFPACLEPIAESLEVEHIICSRPEVLDGRYTGRIAMPMIGDAKAEAVREWLEDREPARTWAYGDHESDLPLLESVSDPVVVGDNSTLVRIARDRGWSRMPRAGSRRFDERVQTAL